MLTFVIITIVFLALFVTSRLLSGRPLWVSGNFLDEDNIALPSNRFRSTISSLPPAIDLPVDPREIETPMMEKMEKIELMSAEKNKMIIRLQAELDAERKHRLEFEKVKALLDAEIARLKDLNRHLKNQKEKPYA